METPPFIGGNSGYVPVQHCFICSSHAGNLNAPFAAILNRHGPHCPPVHLLRPCAVLLGVGAAACNRTITNPTCASPTSTTTWPAVELPSTSVLQLVSSKRPKRVPQGPGSSQAMTELNAPEAPLHSEGEGRSSARSPSSVYYDDRRGELPHLNLGPPNPLVYITTGPDQHKPPLPLYPPHSLLHLLLLLQQIDLCPFITSAYRRRRL